jgi:hypothetical protein
MTDERRKAKYLEYGLQEIQHEAAALKNDKDTTFVTV